MKRLLLICSLFFSVLVAAQEISEPFTFPIKPGTKEWVALKTEKDRFDAMQIPEDALKRISTPALVVSCLNFPAFGYITAFPSYQNGFIFLTTKFNGLDELLKRKDAEKFLMDIYKVTGNYGLINQLVNIDEKYWSIRYSWIEILLAQNELIGTLDKTSKENLLTLTIEKYSTKVASKEYSNYDLQSTLFLMARVLHSINNSEFESYIVQNDALKIFIASSNLSDSNLINTIVDLSENYLKNRKSK